MKTALVLLALLGLAGCASSIDSRPQPVAASASISASTSASALASASIALPRHQIAEMSAPLNRTDVPLKPMTASQSAARMN